MTRSAVLILGAAALVLLAVLCTARHYGELRTASARGAPQTQSAGELRFAAGRTRSRIFLEGTVPDTRTQAALVRRAGAIVGADNVVDELQIKSINPPDHWRDAALALLDALAPLIDGQGSLQGIDLDVQGIASTAATAETARATFAQELPPGYDGLARVSSLDETSEVTARLCGSLLRELMQRPIRFGPGSAVIDSSSFDLLDRLAATAERCPSSRIEISGFIDTDSDREADLELSRAQAEAVRTYFIQTGISPHRLVAVGYGDSPPAGEDTTCTARHNPRIEFLVE